MLAAALLALAASHVTCGWRPGEILELFGKVETGGLTGKLSGRVELGSGRSSETQDLGIVVNRTGFDGHLAWSQDSSGGVHDLNSDFARRLAVSMAWLDGRQGCAPSRKGMTRLGTRIEGKRHLNAWRASPAGGVPFELWYDTHSGRLDRAYFQMAESRLIRHFADWRSVGDNRLVAFRQRDEFPEDEDEVLRHITRAVVRETAAPDDFTRPHPPKDAAILGGRGFTVVPFEDDHRTRIYIPVMLNDKGPFLFELDNGGHNILSSETAAALGLIGTGSFNTTGAGNAVAQSEIARIARMQIGDAILTDQPMHIREYSAASNDRSPNPPRAGILGLELFERFAVAIDPRAKTVTLSSFDTIDRPAGTAVALVFTEDAPLIAGSFAGQRGDFMLDTGNAGATIIEDYWARPLGLTDALNKGVARGDTKVSTATIGIGPFELKDELVSYYGPAERGSEYTRAVAGIYGAPLLSRFKSTYDYSRGTLWIEALSEVEPLPFDRSGLSLAKSDGGNFKVSAVTTGSPADQAGIRKDDVISAVQDKPSDKISRADVSAILREKPGTVVSLDGTFGGAEGTKALILRELIRR